MVLWINGIWAIFHYLLKIKQNWRKSIPFFKISKKNAIHFSLNIFPKISQQFFNYTINKFYKRYFLRKSHNSIELNKSLSSKKVMSPLFSNLLFSLFKINLCPSKLLKLFFFKFRASNIFLELFFLKNPIYNVLINLYQ